MQYTDDIFDILVLEVKFPDRFNNEAYISTQNSVVSKVNSKCIRFSPTTGINAVLNALRGFNENI